jgi:HAL2 family 3'(2'),5'-bisphosphate nucleotidase
MKTTELDLAVHAVRAAARACRSVRREMTGAGTLLKTDGSPVTVADFAAQAVVARALRQASDVPMLAEENADELRQAPAALRGEVARHAAMAARVEANDAEVLRWLAASAVASGALPPRYWVLDPIDGTKGFLRGGQYAIALAFIEDGRVRLAALCCPELSLDGSAPAGIVGAATAGGGAWWVPLDEGDVTPSRKPLRVSAITDADRCRFCESVEAAHSDKGWSGAVIQSLGAAAEPVRMDSQAKYAAVAAGSADVYLRLPTRPGYQECVWDHAAGMLLVQEAGGRVTDVDGKPLDFAAGARLARNRGVVATNGRMHDRVLAAIRATEA